MKRGIEALVDRIQGATLPRARHSAPLLKVWMASVAFGERLILPFIVAPMLRVSGPALVAAACEAGVVGPTRQLPLARGTGRLLAQLTNAAKRAHDAGRASAPYCPNLLMRRDPQTLRADIACILRRRTLTRHFTRMPTSFLASSLRAAGLHPHTLDEQTTAEQARLRFSVGGDGPRRETSLRSAGHSVSGVSRVCSVAELVAELKRALRRSMQRTLVQPARACDLVTQPPLHPDAGGALPPPSPHTRCRGRTGTVFGTAETRTSLP